MHAHIVGELYSPSRRAWPEGADYNFRAGGHELRIFLGRATPREITAVERGKRRTTALPGCGRGSQASAPARQPRPRARGLLVRFPQPGGEGVHDLVDLICGPIDGAGGEPGLSA
jgi:hypothetical protein